MADKYANVATNEETMLAGETAELLVLKLAEQLTADRVYLTDPASQLNHELKTDLVIEVGEVCYPYQIKNSEVGGQIYVAKVGHTVTFDGQTYPAPGLIVKPTTYTERRQLLKRLAAEHGLDYKPGLLKALGLRKQMLSNKQPITQLNLRLATKLFTPQGLEALEVLGYAERRKDVWHLTYKS